MYKRLDKYIEKMQNMKSPIQKKTDIIMRIYGRKDGKNGYINIVNGQATSDYIRRELLRHQMYSSNIKQLIETSTEAVRYEIIRSEFELRCLKERLYKACYEYQALRRLPNPSPFRMHSLREKISVLKKYREETENRLLEIHEEFRLAEETADKLVTQSRELLEKKLYAYLSGAKYYLEKENIENPADLIRSL